MLGFGCKAPLTYTHQFTMVSVKGGVRTEVLIIREDDDTNAVEIEDTSATDEPDGVTVQIPVTQVDRFVRKAHEFFSVWTPGTVLVDGVEPSLPEGQWLDNDILLVPQGSSLVHDDRDVVVMGNVPYKVDYAHRITPGLPGNAIVWVEMGAVEPHSSREALRYNRKTEELLETAKEFIFSTLFRRAQDDVEKSLTGIEAARKALDWWDYLPRDRRHDLRYRDKFLPSTISLRGWFYDANDGSARDLSRSTIKVSSLLRSNAAVIVGHPTKTLSKSQRTKIDIYLDSQTQHAEVKFVYVLAEHPSIVWLEGLETIPWSDIESVQIPRQPKKSSTPDDPIIHVLDERGCLTYYTASNLPTDKPFVIIDYRTASADGSRWQLESVASAFDDSYTIVALSRRRWAKFAREHEVVDVEAAVEDELRVLRSRLSERQQAIALDRNRQRDALMPRLDPNLIKDTLVADVVRDLRNPDVASAGDRYYVLTQAAARLGHGDVADRVPFNTETNVFRKIFRRYPLLSGLTSFYGRVDSQDVIDYLNALYVTTHHMTEEEN